MDAKKPKKGNAKGTEPQEEIGMMDRLLNDIRGGNFRHRRNSVLPQEVA